MPWGWTRSPWAGEPPGEGPAEEPGHAVGLGGGLPQRARTSGTVGPGARVRRGGDPGPWRLAASERASPSPGPRGTPGRPGAGGLVLHRIRRAATSPSRLEDLPSEGEKKGKGGEGLLGASSGRRWGRWAVVAVMVLAAGSFGAYRWLLSGDGAAEAGTYPLAGSDPGVLGEAGSSLGGVDALGPVTLTFVSEGQPEGSWDPPSPSPSRRTEEREPPSPTPLSSFWSRWVMRSFPRMWSAPTPKDWRKEPSNFPPSPARWWSRLPWPGPPEVEAFFQVTALTGSPSQAAVIYGDRQSADPGARLGDPVGVRVRDEFGNPVAGVEVRFQVIQGGGRVSPSSAETDEAGRAYARWTLGDTPGTQLLGAVVPDTEDALVTFHATALGPAQPTPSPREENPPPTPAPTPALEPAPGPVDVVTRTFAVGGSNVCHLVEGDTRCRGANDRGQGGGGSLVGLVSLAEGVAHGCGLDVSGSAWCWGANDSGQLGEGSTRDRSVAVPVDTPLRFSMLVAGLSHTCGLGAGGVAYCWGRNLSGQLGDGTRDDKLRPERVSGGHTFRDLVAGWNHTCGLASGGRVFCWGANGDGQLGDESRVDRLVPTGVGGSFQALAAGAGHTCGLSGGEVLCWGDNAFGQLGDGTTEDRPAPVTVPDLPGTVMSIAAGAVHTCALLTDRRLFCWGQNLHGQLGDGTTLNRTSPVPVAGDISFVAVFAGGGVTCGFARDGAEYCWGLNSNGQLGDGTRTNRSSPVRVGGGSP